MRIDAGSQVRCCIGCKHKVRRFKAFPLQHWGHHKCQISKRDLKCKQQAEPLPHCPLSPKTPATRRHSGQHHIPQLCRRRRDRARQSYNKYPPSLPPVLNQKLNSLGSRDSISSRHFWMLCKTLSLLLRPWLLLIPCLPNRYHQSHTQYRVPRPKVRNRPFQVSSRFNRSRLRMLLLRQGLPACHLRPFPMTTPLKTSPPQCLSRLHRP